MDKTNSYSTMLRSGSKNEEKYNEKIKNSKLFF